MSSPPLLRQQPPSSSTWYVMDSVKQLSSAVDVKLNLSLFDIKDRAVAIWDRLAHFLKQWCYVCFINRSSLPHSPQEGSVGWYPSHMQLAVPPGVLLCVVVVQIRYYNLKYNRLKKCVFLCYQLQLFPVNRTPSSSSLWWLWRGPSSSSSWCLASSLGEGTLSRAPLTLRSCESALVNYVLSFTGLHLWSPHTHSHTHQHRPVACWWIVPHLHHPPCLAEPSRLSYHCCLTSDTFVFLPAWSSDYKLDWHESFMQPARPSRQLAVAGLWVEPSLWRSCKRKNQI